MLDLLASDMSIDEILADYPDLEREDLLACLEYAAQLSRTKKSQKVVQWEYSLTLICQNVWPSFWWLTVSSQNTLLTLPKKNATPDSEIIRFADADNRIVISKDSDFIDNYILDGSPKKLLIVSTGNINNRDLIGLFEKNLEALKSLFEENSVLEINEEEIQVHY